MSVFISLIIVNIFLVIILKIYHKLTTGICRTSAYLVGKVVIVTGANCGIGFETAKDLADRGAKVLIACRNESLGLAACEEIIKVTENKNVYYRHLDLSSLKSVREFAQNILETEKRLDILINNAGVYNAGLKKTEDGLLAGMQTNHFGPFLLTNLLLPLLKCSRPSRIINVSSFYYTRGKLDLENLNMEKETEATFSDHQVYANSKLCNVLMTIELSRRLKGTGVTANCLHPGGVATNIMRSYTNVVIKYLLKMFSFLSKTPWEGAQTTIYLAVSRDLTEITGRYYSDCKERNLTSKGEDVDMARLLWEKSEQLVKLK